MSRSHFPRNIIVVVVAAILLCLFLIPLFTWKPAASQQIAPPSPTGNAQAPEQNAHQERSAAELPLQYPSRIRSQIIDVSKDPAFADLVASPISLDLEGASAQEAINALYKATSTPPLPGNRSIPFFRPPDPITLHLKDAPYLEVLLQFAAQANTSLRTLSSDVLEFSPSMSGVGPARDQSSVGIWCIAGPFAVALERIETHVAFAAAQSPTHDATITFTTFAEPRLSVVRYPHQLNIDTFSDENGKPLSLASPPANSGIANRSPSTMRLPIHLPGERGGKIAVLKGTAPFVLLTESTAMDATVGGSETITRNVAGMKVEIMPPGPTSGRPAAAEFKVRFSQADMPEDCWKTLKPILAGIPVKGFGIATLRAPARGRPAAEPPVPPTTLVAPSSPPNVRLGPAQPDGSILLTISTGQSNTAYPLADRIVINVPSAVREVAVPFEFKNILLP